MEPQRPDQNLNAPINAQDRARAAIQQMTMDQREAAYRRQIELHRQRQIIQQQRILQQAQQAAQQAAQQPNAQMRAAMINQARGRGRGGFTQMRGRGVMRYNAQMQRNQQYPTAPVKHPLLPTIPSRRSNQVSGVIPNEFFKEHRNRFIDLEPLKKKIDDILVDNQRKKLFWSCFRNFLTSKISKSEFTRIVKERVIVPQVIPLFNYFVRCLLHNSRLSITDEHRNTTFDQYFHWHGGDKAPVSNESFGTLVTSGLIDFNRFSCDPKVPCFTSTIYGNDFRYFGTQTSFEVKFVSEKIHVGMRKYDLRSLGSSVVPILQKAVYTYVKNVLQVLVESKLSQKKIVPYKHNLLRGYRVGSPLLNSFPSTTLPAVSHSYFHYKDEVMDACERQHETAHEARIRSDIRKLEILRATNATEEEFLRLKRYGYVHMNGNDLNKFVANEYPRPVKNNTNDKKYDKMEDEETDSNDFVSSHEEKGLFLRGKIDEDVSQEMLDHEDEMKFRLMREQRKTILTEKERGMEVVTDDTQMEPKEPEFFEDDGEYTLDILITLKDFLRVIDEKRIPIPNYGKFKERLLASDWDLL